MSCQMPWPDNVVVVVECSSLGFHSLRDNVAFMARRYTNYADWLTWAAGGDHFAALNMSDPRVYVQHHSCNVITLAPYVLLAIIALIYALVYIVPRMMAPPPPILYAAPVQADDYPAGAAPTVG
jgi:hypothetical protein